MADLGNLGLRYRAERQGVGACCGQDSGQPLKPDSPRVGSSQTGGRVHDRLYAMSSHLAGYRG